MELILFEISCTVAVKIEIVCTSAYFGVFSVCHKIRDFGRVFLELNQVTISLRNDDF